MAALHHGAAAAALHRRRLIPENISLVKPVFFISSFSTSSPAKQARRRNHLRQKILKTLKKPLIPKLLHSGPIATIEPTPKEIDVYEEIQELEKSENSELAEGEESRELQEVKEVEVSVPAVVGIAGQNSFLKYGLWFLGAFVFQTVCAVMFVGLDETNNKKDIMDRSGEFRAKYAILDSATGDGYVNVDNPEMELKIEEIRLMAREVRERERLQSNGNGKDGDEADEGKNFKSEIEEEVDGSMFKLKKKLEKTRFKTPFGRETKRKVEVENGDLLYKKKYKFKDFSFIGPDISTSRVNGDVEEEKEVNGNGDDNAADAVQVVDGEKQGVDAVQLVEVDNKKEALETTEVTRNTRSKATKERGASKQGKTKGVAKPKVINGNVEKNKGGSVKSRKPDVEAVKSGKSSNLDAAVVSTTRGKGFGNTKPAKSKSESFWWWNLPYVLVIFMQRGSGGEGLYTLKGCPTSSTEDQTSYTVAFEDRADATNFCYLMESFFEDLGDFKADVVPLTVKELKEAEESYSLRALVVKKGQLQLYAGQPLTDAEMVLRTMIEQDQSM